MLLLDIDCVLTDFVGAAAAKWGFTRRQVEAVQPPGVYNVVPHFGRLLRESGRLPPSREFTEKDFWGKLDKDRGFWADMPETPWCDDLIDLCSKMCPTFELVTAPSWCPQCYAGKVEWVQRKFGLSFPSKRLHLTAAKERLARPDTVLLDDNEGNVKRFRAAGGRAVLFPTHHNRLHRLKETPIPRTAGKLVRELHRART